MVEATKRLLTAGEIADRLHRPIHQVTYLIRSRNIKPAARAGHLRVFGESDLTFIAAELRRIEAEKAQVAL